MICFESIPKNIVKSHMKLRGICVKDMIALLNERGECLDIKSFNNKMYRGQFNAIFFIKCLKAMNVKNIELDFFEDPISTKNIAKCNTLEEKK